MYKKALTIALLLLAAPSAFAQSSVEISGTFSYTVNTANDTVQLSVAKILNNSTTYTTGTLRLELWLTTSPYTGGNINGYRVATYQITGSTNGELGPNQYFSNISATVPLTDLPAAGSYDATLIVSEYTQNCGTVDGYCIDTYGAFDTPFVVGGGGNTGGSTTVQLMAPYSYSVNFSAGTLSYSIAEIENTSQTYTTGTLRIEFWLTTTPYSGGDIDGFRIATSQITGSSNGQLGPNQSFQNLSGTASLTDLPSPGTYYVALIVSEYTQNCGSSDGYCIDTYGNFQNTMAVPDTDTPVDVAAAAGAAAGGGGAFGWDSLTGLAILLALRLARGMALPQCRRASAHSADSSNG